MSLDDALAKVRDVTLEVGEEHLILGAALTLLLRCANFSRPCQHRLLTAGAALVETVELCLAGNGQRVVRRKH